MSEKEGTASPSPQRSPLSPGEKTPDSIKESGSLPESGKASSVHTAESHHSHTSFRRSKDRGGPRSVSRSSYKYENKYEKRSYSRSPRRRRYSRSRSYGRRRSPYYNYRSRTRSPYNRRSRSPYYRRSRSPYYNRRGGEGGRSNYRSRSRSRSYSPGRHRYGSGYSDRRRGFYRSHSRSPMSSRRRHTGNRDNPETSRCIGVFGLSLFTEERDLKDVFGRYGPIDTIQVVMDHQTGKSRGFSFIYYKNENDAIEAKDRATGTEIDGRRIRVDFSITHRAHTPTPGIYLGKPTPGKGYRNRSNSPEGNDHGERRYYSRSRSRSREYSYSPRSGKNDEGLKNEI